ncbi:MAG: DNA primase [Chitinispirillaceae bacterium]|nr:DNA primase [Chitinispirillaceae bacterium]
MATFDDSAKEEIRQRADIAAIVGRYVKLKPMGPTLKGLCPFHKEKSPSFHVNPSRGFYHCFGCGKGGDVFSFLQEIEGYSFPEALKSLADETGVKLAPARQLTHETAPSPDQAISKTDLLEINQAAADFFYGQVRQNPQAIDYFKSRGLSGETVRDFKLGFAPSGWSSLVDFFASRGTVKTDIAAAGLAVRKDDGSVYDRFRNRVMFTLVDLAGRIVGFAGRGMDSETMPKYLNSPETQLYKKKEFLYGFHITRQFIKDEKQVLVVEGYMDFLTLYQAGIKNIVATSGTAMTPEHANMLRRFTTSVVLVFDGDEAGQKAAERGIFTLAPFDLDVTILVLPPEEDPDSFVKSKGPEAFRALIASSRNANDFIIDRTIAELGGKTPRAQKAVIEKLSPLIGAMSNTLGRSKFRKDLAEQLGIDEKVVYKFTAESGSPSYGKPPAGVIPADEAYLHTLEGSFLHILISRPELIVKARQYIATEILTDEVASDIYSKLQEIYDEEGNVDGILNRIQDEEIRRIISRMLISPAREEHIHDELVQKIVHLKRKFLKSRIRTNRLLLKSAVRAGQSAALMQHINDDLKQLKDLDDKE